jgi:protein O-mannosyl-transferase
MVRDPKTGNHSWSSFERVNAGSNRLQSLGVCAILAVAVLAVYWPVRNHDFVKYDDDAYVTDNRNVQSGLNARSLRWAFTSGHASNWHPVTWLSHMVDCEIFGLNPRGPHLVNLLLHTANTLLLFIVLKRMTGRMWPSALVAALFGLHPLHVESVAWVAERKDVLSTLFWMLTMLAYAWYAEKPKIVRYLPVLLAFMLGLMAKPMLVTLPFVLLLLDYWPLERMRLAGADRESLPLQERGGGIAARPSLRRLLLEKVPLLALAIASSIVTFVVQRQGGAVMKVEMIDLRSRIGNAIVAYVGYIEKMFWPGKLAVLYLHSGGDLSKIKILACGLSLFAISLCLLWAALRRKYLAVGWLWYLGTLVPVIGLVQVGVQSMADRYTYVPLIGLFIVVTWGVADLLAGWPRQRSALIVLATAILVALAARTSAQLKHWQNSLTLFDHAIAVTTDNYVMLNNYANVLLTSGRPDEAVAQFNRSLQIRPGNAGTHNDLANAYNKLGRIDTAIEEYRKASSLDPNSAQIHYNLALALSKRSRTEEAIREYREVVRLRPDHVDALVNLGSAYSELGRIDAAIEEYRKALKLAPNCSEAHYNLALALSRQNRPEEAIREYGEAVRLSPDNADALLNLGNELEGQGNSEKAIEVYKRVLVVQPDNIIAHGQLGLALATAGRIDEASAEIRIVLKARPDDAEMWCNLGILLERQGKTSEAVEAYRRALRIDPADARAQSLLNAASSKEQ